MLKINSDFSYEMLALYLIKTNECIIIVLCVLYHCYPDQLVEKVKNS